MMNVNAPHAASLRRSPALVVVGNPIIVINSIILLLAAAVTVGIGGIDAICTPSRCISEDFQNIQTDINATKPYFDCMQRASGTRAFECRCSLKIRDCLFDPEGGNCSTNREVKYACNMFLSEQNWGCSFTLCRNGAASSFRSLATIGGLGWIVVVLIFV